MGYYHSDPLLEYFGHAAAQGGFSAAAPTLDPGDTSLSARDVQIFLNESGYKQTSGKPLVEDGVWKKVDQDSMSRYAAATLRANNKDVSAEPMAGNTKMYVFPSSFGQQIRAKLQFIPRWKQTAAQPAKTTTPAPVTGGGLVSASVLMLQKELNKRGFKGKNGKVLAEDGTYGANTAFAFQAWAKANKLPAAISADGKDHAKIELAAYQKINTPTAGTASTSGASGTKPVTTQPPKPPPKPAAATVAVSKPVAEIQHIVITLGTPSSKDLTDGLWGKKTAAAWQAQAKAHKLDATITRIDGKTASVNTHTFEVLSAGASPTGPTTPVSQPGGGLSPAPVADIQRIVIALGTPSNKDLTDGKYGKKTEAAWQAQAKAHQLDPTIQRVDGTHAKVNSATFQALNAASKNKPAAQHLVPILVRDVQKIVIALGTPATKDLSDGLWGQKTVTAWQKQAGDRKLDATIEKVDGKTARVVEATQKALEAAAVQKTSKKTPPPAPDTSKVHKSVADIQRIVVALGVPKSKPLSDGLWGSATVEAWKKVATARKLTGQITKVNGKTASVLKSEYDVLDAAAKGQGGHAVPPKPPTPQPKTEGNKVVVEVTRGVIPTAINRLRGVAALSDKSKDADLAKAWQEETKKRHLDPTITFPAKDKAKVEAAAIQAISAEALKKPAPVPAGLVDVIITTVQKAENASAGKSVVGVTGKWDKTTEELAIKMLGAPKAQIDARLNGKKTALRLEPDLAKKVGALAKAWDDSEKKRKAAEATAQNLVTVHVDELQRALNANKGLADDSFLPITSVWDAKTKAAYIQFAQVPKAAESAVDKLVSADKKTVRLSPKAANAVDQLATKWEQAQAQVAADQSAKDAAAKAAQNGASAAAATQAAQDASQTAAAVNTPATPATPQTLPTEYVTGQAPDSGMTVQQPPSNYSNVINFPGTQQPTQETQVIPGPAPAIVPDVAPPPVPMTDQPVPPAPVAPPAPDAPPAPAPASGPLGLPIWVWIGAGAVVLGGIWWLSTQDPNKQLPAEASA